MNTTKQLTSKTVPTLALNGLVVGHHAVLSSSNYVGDADAFLDAFEDKEQAQAILDVLRSNVSLEDNGFRNLDDGLMMEQGDAKPGEVDILDNLKFYMGDSRAWRDGFKPESFARHVRKTNRQQADNGVSWGKFSLIEEKPKYSKDERIAAKLEALAAKQAKRKA